MGHSLTRYFYAEFLVSQWKEGNRLERVNDEVPAVNPVTPELELMFYCLSQQVCLVKLHFVFGTLDRVYSINQFPNSTNTSNKYCSWETRFFKNIFFEPFQQLYNSYALQCCDYQHRPIMEPAASPGQAIGQQALRTWKSGKVGGYFLQLCIFKYSISLEWNELGDMNKFEAMRLFVKALEFHDKHWGLRVDKGVRGLSSLHNNIFFVFSEQQLT